MNRETDLLPTVCNSTDEGDRIVLHTIDGNSESDIVLRDGYQPIRRGDLAEEQAGERI